MKVKLELSKDIITLVRNITFNFSLETGSFTYNKTNPYGFGHLKDDMALILGFHKDFIPGTEFEPDGKQYPKEIEDKMNELHQYIMDNFDNIIDYMFFSFNPSPGNYSKNSYDRTSWKKIQ